MHHHTKGKQIHLSRDSQQHIMKHGSNVVCAQLLTTLSFDTIGNIFYQSLYTQIMIDIHTDTFFRFPAVYSTTSTAIRYQLSREQT